MSVQLVIDMNLSVDWVTELAQHGWSAVHWSTIGDPCADDTVMRLGQAYSKSVAKTYCLKTSGP